MTNIKNPEVAKKFPTYPAPFKKKLLLLRRLIFETASEIECVDEVEETLKWGEPGYATKTGSTIRIGWKESNPDRYAMYFHCNTTLVDTFKELYSDQLNFDGNRVIVFNQDDEIPIAEVKQCISLALEYHRIKHLPLVGA